MPGKYCSLPLWETKKVSTGGIYEHRSALVATSALHNSMLLMCWNCFWRRTDWYNAVCGSSRAGPPVLKSDSMTLGQSIHLHWLSLAFVLRAQSLQTCRGGPLRGAAVLLCTGTETTSELLLLAQLIFTVNRLMPLILCQLEPVKSDVMVHFQFPFASSYTRAWALDLCLCVKLSQHLLREYVNAKSNLLKAFTDFFTSWTLVL